MAIEINAVDLEWKGRYGGGGGGAGGGDSGLSTTQVQSMISQAVAGINAGVSVEEVQKMIEDAGTGGSVDVPWQEIQIGYVSRSAIIAYNGGVSPVNNTNFNIPYPKPFSQPPVVIARAALNGVRFDTQMSGGTEKHFAMQTNYGPDLTGVHFIAFVPKG